MYLSKTVDAPHCIAVAKITSGPYIAMRRNMLTCHIFRHDRNRSKTVLFRDAHRGSILREVTTSVRLF